jgi:putative transposase
MNDLLYASHAVHEVKAHYVWSLKYRKSLLNKKEYREKVKEVVGEVGKRYWYRLENIGTDGDHIHLLIQSNPDDSFSKIVKTIKSISAREMFKTFPELKKLMWGASLWESGYFVRTVGDETTAEMIRKYIDKQGKSRGVKEEQIRMF